MFISPTVTPEDLALPTMVQAKKKLAMHAKDRNYMLLSARNIRGKRVLIRISFEAYGPTRKTINFNRLQGESLLLSFSTVNQARAAIKLLQDCVISLSGKYLDESNLD